MEKANKIVSPGKRFLSALADLFILFIIASGIYSILVYPLMQQLPHYKKMVNDQESNINYCRDMYVNGKLMKYDTEVDDFIEECLKDKLSDYNNDNIIYYYIAYLPTIHKDNVTFSYAISEINESVYNYSNQGETILWELTDNDINKPLSFTETAKTNIEKYLADDVTKENEAYYLKVIKWYQYSLVNAEKILKSSDEFTEHYSLSLKDNETLFFYASTSSLLTYIVFFILYYYVLPLILKNGQTVGKKIMKIGLYTNDNKPISKKRLALRVLLQFITYYFLVMFIPIFELGTAIINLPALLFPTFSIDLVVFALISFLLAVVSFIVLTSTEDKQSLHDRVLDVYAYRMDVQLEEENTIKNEEVLGKKEEKKDD